MILEFCHCVVLHKGGKFNIAVIVVNIYIEIISRFDKTWDIFSY